MKRGERQKAENSGEKIAVAGKKPKAVSSSDSPTARGKDEALPLVVCDGAGSFLFLAATNRKGFTKSLEQGSLWLTHPRTGRLLPCEKGESLLCIQDRGGYFCASVAGADGFLKAASKKRAAKKGEPGLNAAFPKNALKDFEVLPALAALIARRRREMPEGSYTTHLFKSGAGKIRKKTGEEAVELILAQGKSEIICEAADLVYHLLVLLEAEGVGLGEVLGELKGRG